MGLKSPKIRHLRTIAQLCRAISSQLRHMSTIGKKLLTRNVGQMPNVMAALPNTGGALSSTPQFGYAVTLPRRETR